MRLAAPTLRLWRILAVAAVAASGTIAVAQSSGPQAPAVAGFLDSAEEHLDREVEQLPAWLAKSTRESLALGKADLPGLDFTPIFTKTVAQIVVRDGVELHTEIYAPRTSTQALPIILERTPYGLHPDKFGYSARLRAYTYLMRDGYIFVFQDVRGRGTSTGYYVTAGPLRDPKVKKSTDDSTDAYDTIDWLIRHVPNNNGRVGMLGISYDGFLTTRALVNPHPALKAASPQATCADLFMGDDFHHNGAFRLAYSFEWIAAMEQGIARAAILSRYDRYDRFLELGPLANINELILHGQAPSWNAFAAHPNLDRFWRTDMCGVLPHIQSPVTVPTLDVGGWFDAEDFYGTIRSYEKYEQGDVQGINNLVIGPWYHGGWTLSTGRTLGAIDFASDTARWYRQHVEAPWFAHWLKDAPRPQLPEVLSFRTGANQWQSYDAWPPRAGTHEAKLYLRAGGALSFDPPGEATAADQYVSDPAKPVPFMPRPITENGWPEWETVDQRFADGRPDVLTYQTAPLQEALTVTGELIAHLCAATSGSDADWVVKLIDVYPEKAEPENMGGFQLMVAGEVFRARFRDSFEKPHAVEPGQVAAYEFSLRSRDHTFNAGHRIMVQVQSTWFPLIDRNPQTYVPNIYAAVQSDFQKATQSISRSRGQPSYILLPVNGGAGSPWKTSP